MGGREEARAERRLPLQGERQSGGRPDQKVLVARRDGARRQRAMRCLGRAWGSPISDVFVGAPVFVLERPVPVVPVVFFFFFPHRVCVCVSKVLITVISSRAHLPSTPQVPHPPSHNDQYKGHSSSRSRRASDRSPEKVFPQKKFPKKNSQINQFLFFSSIPRKDQQGGRGSKCLTAGATRPPRLRAGTVGLRRRKRAGEGGGSETASGNPP